MKLQFREFWPLLVVPIACWLALFSYTNPPKPEPLAPRFILHDWTEVDDLGPLEFPKGEAE